MQAVAEATRRHHVKHQAEAIAQAQSPKQLLDRIERLEGRMTDLETSLEDGLLELKGDIRTLRALIDDK